MSDIILYISVIESLTILKVNVVLSFLNKLSVAIEILNKWEIDHTGLLDIKEIQLCGSSFLLSSRTVYCISLF